jgi:hypothetical protein
MNERLNYTLRARAMSRIGRVDYEVLTKAINQALEDYPIHEIYIVDSYIGKLDILAVDSAKRGKFVSEVYFRSDILFKKFTIDEELNEFLVECDDSVIDRLIETYNTARMPNEYDRMRLTYIPSENKFIYRMYDKKGTLLYNKIYFY